MSFGTTQILGHLVLEDPRLLSIFPSEGGDCVFTFGRGCKIGNEPIMIRIINVLLIISSLSDLFSFVSSPEIVPLSFFANACFDTFSFYYIADLILHK
jgi:hypothetical protein